MPPTNQGSSLAGSFRIFAVAGITVYVHWTWLIVAVIELQLRTSAYQAWVWNVAEYLSLFFIVLLHEFGHAFACRQVGGEANEIVLWPLGGIAFVNPPPRPGALLWSIAAGPLVNVILIPITIGILVIGSVYNLQARDADANHFLKAVAFMNIGLLIFNILPIYPLDGGQILHALLWFVTGRAKSLKIVSVIGLIAAIGLIGLALLQQTIMLGVLAAFAALRCWAGIQQAKLLSEVESLPRHPEAECPTCSAHPLSGPYWECDHCRARFDMFDSRGFCPDCNKEFAGTTCMDCGRVHPIWAWFDSDGRYPNG